MMSVTTSMRFSNQTTDTEHFNGSSDRLVDMLAFSGHELNNVLTRLLLNVEWLIRDPKSTLTEQQIQAIHSLSQNARLLRSIANSYMSLARLEDDSFVLNTAPLDPVAQIIEPLVEGYAEVLNEQRQSCEIRSLATGNSICADPALMTSVFDNLLNNAIKYGAQSSQILIEVTRTGADLEVRVSNRAHDVDPGSMNQLFDRFTRGANTKNKNGSGIGLYLTKRIVETHGGSIQVEATPRGEVAFTVSLPAYIA